jgi:AraC-like DNA-binding protein
VRLRRALVLLSRGSMSVREVALAVGYVDQYHFSRRFRETFDLSPRVPRGAAAVQAAVPCPAGPGPAGAGPVRRRDETARRGPGA